MEAVERAVEVSRTLTTTDVVEKCIEKNYRKCTVLALAGYLTEPRNLDEYGHGVLGIVKYLIEKGVKIKAVIADGNGIDGVVITESGKVLPYVGALAAADHKQLYENVQSLATKLNEIAENVIKALRELVQRNRADP